MLVTLRILFTVISAVFVASILPVGAFLGWGWAGACGLFSVLFFVLMLLCKQSQEFKEREEKRFSNDFIQPTNSEENK